MLKFCRYICGFLCELDGSLLYGNNGSHLFWNKLLVIVSLQGEHLSQTSFCFCLDYSSDLTTSVFRELENYWRNDLTDSIINLTYMKEGFSQKSFSTLLIMSWGKEHTCSYFVIFFLWLVSWYKGLKFCKGRWARFFHQMKYWKNCIQVHIYILFFWAHLMSALNIFVYIWSTLNSSMRMGSEKQHGGCWECGTAGMERIPTPRRSHLQCERSLFSQQYSSEPRKSLGCRQPVTGCNRLGSQSESLQKETTKHFLTAQMNRSSC